VRPGPGPCLPRRCVSPWRQSPWARSPLGGEGAGPAPGPAPAARPRRTAPPVRPPRPPPAAGRSRDPSPSPPPVRGWSPASGTRFPLGLERPREGGVPPFPCLVRGGLPSALTGLCALRSCQWKARAGCGGEPLPPILQGRCPPSGCTGPPSCLVRGIPFLRAAGDSLPSYVMKWTLLPFPWVVGDPSLSVL